MSSKGRQKVNQMRSEKAKEEYRKNIAETEKKNRQQPVEVWQEDSPGFKIYKPGRMK